MTTVAILSDVHMRNEHRDAVVRALEAIRARLTQENPAHVFVLGDLIQDSDDPTTDRENVARVRELLDGLPVTYLLGNHDTVTLARSEIAEILGQTAFRGRVDIEGESFVSLDSQQPGHRVVGAVGESQREWLAETMPTDAIVLGHHPIGPLPIRDNHWFGDAPARAFVADQQAVLDIVCPAARATVCGHIHQTSAVRYRGVSHLSINAISKELPDKPVTGTWAVLDLEQTLTADLFVRDEHEQSLTLE